MGLLDEARAESSKRARGTICSVGKLLNTLEGKEREELEEALNDYPGISHGVLCDVMARRNMRIARETLSTHRRRICRCYR